MLHQKILTTPTGRDTRILLLSVCGPSFNAQKSFSEGEMQCNHLRQHILHKDKGRKGKKQNKREQDSIKTFSRLFQDFHGKYFSSLERVLKETRDALSFQDVFKKI